MIARPVYEMLTGEDDGRVCRDIPDSACNDQPRNFLLHVLALGATKTADGLSDAKLVLAWMLGALGAPAAAAGMLVPVREAGALLPQLFTAAAIRSKPQRKWIWAAGSLVQGLSVVGMAAAALTLDGVAAGWTIVFLLGVLAVARSACSVAYKDVLGKTVSKSTRGTATGSASTIGAASVLLFGVLISIGVIEKSVAALCGALAVAGALWAVSALMFTTLSEEPGATEGGGNAIDVVRDQIGLLREDPQLVRFIAARGLLTGTALAPPYLVALAGSQGGGGLGTLGPFVIASALAGITSTYVWGRLSDKSSRRVLVLAAIVGAIALGVAAALGFGGSGWMRSPLFAPALLFVLMIAYQGVRIGRSTHLVDMASAETRGAYTALSNTIIGIVLLASGVFGVIAQYAGDPVVLGLFALMCAAGAIVARGLENVQDD
jgi:hypothetical protein